MQPWRLPFSVTYSSYKIPSLLDNRVFYFLHSDALTSGVLLTLEGLCPLPRLASS